MFIYAIKFSKIIIKKFHLKCNVSDPFFKYWSYVKTFLSLKKCNLQIAAEISAPLAKTEDIILIGGSDQVSSEVTKLVSQIPPTVQALTGVDLTKVNFDFLLIRTNPVSTINVKILYTSF